MFWINFPNVNWFLSDFYDLTTSQNWNFDQIPKCLDSSYYFEALIPILLYMHKFMKYLVGKLHSMPIRYLLPRTWCCINTLRQRQSRHYFTDIFKYIFVNENIWIPIKISLMFVPMVPINNILALVQIMARCHPGDKPLSEPMMASLWRHICVIQPQWVNLVTREVLVSIACLSINFSFV